MAKKRRDTRAEMHKRFTRQKLLNQLASPGPRKMIIILDSLKPNYNIGKIFRSAEAFGIQRIHLVGIDSFDPAPAKGAFRHVPASFAPDFAACHADLLGEGYTLFTMDPHRGEALHTVDLPEKCGFIFGHEEFGISFSPADYPAIRRVRIPQAGRVESLNVSVAASIAMYEYARRFPVPAQAE